MSGASVTISSMDTLDSSAITTIKTLAIFPAAHSNDSSKSEIFQPNESLPESNNFIGNDGIVGQIPNTSTPTNAAGSNGNENTNDLGLGITLMQSSPPPHSYRHSRAYRHFKNPPQPHMCIRTTNEVGEELFINVLSWTRLMVPQEPSDPIPLYGGMRVPPGSPRSPPIVFAVMAHPEVLKDSGRHSKNPDERRAMVVLMCDFVEAMNPGVKLVRNGVILKDRDISGELKDVWNAVQAQRDREREEQMMQQRQQQHFHNVATQQMIPKTSTIEVAGSDQNSQVVDTNTCKEASSERCWKNEEVLPQVNQEQDYDSSVNIVDTSSSHQGHDSRAINIERGEKNSSSSKALGTLEVVLNGERHGVTKNIPNGQVASNFTFQNQQQNGSCDQLDAIAKDKSLKSPKDEAKAISTNSNKGEKLQQSQQQTAMNSANDNTKKITSLTSSSGGSSKMKGNSKSTTTSTGPVSTKKEKLGGFLPNGCIFPRFKNNKNKDKDKESKPKDKEKTLLNALKKNKDKKVTPIEKQSGDKNIKTTTTTTSPSEVEIKSQYEKNCLTLESEVEKLDLNKIETLPNNENIFIKLKMTK